MNKSYTQIIHKFDRAVADVWVKDTSLLQTPDPKSMAIGNRSDRLALRAIAKLIRYIMVFEDTSQGHAYWARVVQNMVDLTVQSKKRISPYKGLTKGEKLALMSFLKYGGK